MACSRSQVRSLLPPNLRRYLITDIGYQISELFRYDGDAFKFELSRR